MSIDRRTAIASLGAAAGAACESGAIAAPVAGALIATELKVDHLSAPAGLISPRPRFQWTRAARDPDRRGLRQTAARVVLTGPDGRTLYDSGHVATDEPALVPDRDIDLPLQTPLDWRVTLWDQHGRPSPWSPPARLLTGAGDRWRGRWIAAEPDGAITAPAIEGRSVVSSAYRLPLLRRGFTIPGRVRHAVLCVSGLGAHAVSLNGREASGALLNPGWTDYRRTVLYETIDVTALLRVGDNMLGMRLGGGMYDVASRPGRYTKFVGSYGAPKLILQLRIVMDDGREQWVVSDDSWTVRTGPVLFSSIYGGEDHDARLEPARWDDPESAAQSGWTPVVRTTSPGGILRPQGMPGLAVTRTVATVAVTHAAPGVTVHDLGLNFSGRPRLLVRGRAGAIVRIRPGELVDAAGRVDQRSMGPRRGNAILFTYILGPGGGTQTWAPRFTYTGFRYLEVEVEGDATVVALDGDFVRAALPASGDFACSDARITAIHGLIRQAVLSNVATVVTDCPTREKLGWLEQTWLNAGTIFLSVDAMPLYSKLTDDILDGQRADGMVPSIVPEYIRFVHGDGTDTPFRHSPEWGSAIVQAPWAAYRYTGDAGPLARAYPAMQRYLAYLAAQSAEGLVDVGLGDWYDIGPKPPGPSQLTSRAFTGNAVWYDDLRTLARIATLLGHTSDAADAERKSERLKARIVARFFDPATGGFDRDSQTANAMALTLGLATPDRAAGVLRNLIADVHRRGDHVSAGDIGFHYVVRALSAQTPDVLAAMLARPDAPSYAAQLAKGATSLTEAWDANPESSQNHFMLGHVMTWLFARIGGIDLDFARGGDEALLIAPRGVPGVVGGRATLPTTIGKVRTRWRQDAGGFRLHVDIPPGAVARVRLPTTDPAHVSEGGRRIDPNLLLAAVAEREGTLDLRVGSGRYAFAVAH